MRKREYLRYVIGLACLFIALFSFPNSVAASTFVVNTTDDLDDGICDASHCSLREAINNANANPGADSITFNIPGPGPHVIMLTDMLTVSDDQTHIDGSSQPGYSGSPIIILDGGNSLCRGLWIASNDNIVIGLSFVRFKCAALSTAIHVWGGMIGGGEGNQILKNFIGVDASGAPAGNVYGLMLWDPKNVIRGNVISGNFIGIMSADEKQIIEGNRIGTDPSGMTTSPGFRNETGILLQAGADDTKIGAGDPALSNQISGNDIAIDIESDGNAIIGNLIGTNASGDAALPNLDGIIVDGNANLIGGSGTGEGNLISGNSSEGLVLIGNNNVVLGNLIGTDLSGTTAIANSLGIHILGDENIIGGSGPSEGNVISGNYTGVMFPSPAENNRILGNKIGTTSDGSSPIANNLGISILFGAQHNAIGGLASGEGNLIAYNAGEGILIGHLSHENPILGNTIRANNVGIWVRDAGERNTFSRNTIYENTGLGIDLGPSGVSPNDVGDLDTGANTLLNFPEITSAGSTSVSGTACIGCTVELFIADQDPSGHGEGQVFLDAATADASGNFTIPVFFPIATCTRVTTTATDASGNTSEFSENHAIGFCLIIQFPWVIFIGIIFIGIGVIGGRYAGRFTALSPGTTAAIGGVFGAVLSAGLVILAVVLPSVEVEIPQRTQELQPIMNRCEQYLDPEGFSPSDGAVFEIAEIPRLEWSPMGPLPEGQIRWRVDLLGPENLELSQMTSETNLPFSTFGVSPISGRRYHWRVIGEQAEQTGHFEPFCTSISWRSFYLGSPPPMEAPPETPESPTPSASPTPTRTPTVTPTPTPEACIYTALQNANCRASDFKESAHVATLLQGEMAELIALNPEFTHGKFQLPSTQQCWIWLGLLDGPPNPFGTCDVPVVEPPPKPTDTPTPIACTPELDKEMCEASGGKWPEGVGAAPQCICPE